MRHSADMQRIENTLNRHITLYLARYLYELLVAIMMSLLLILARGVGGLTQGGRTIAKERTNAD